MSIDPYNISQDPTSLQRALKLLRQDFDSHDHDGANSKTFQTLSAETVSARTILIRKTSFTDTTNGWWSGLVDNVLKWYLGDATNYIQWNGTTLTITGTITGSTITGGSLNIGNGNFTVDSSGNASAIGMSTLNMKAYTNFEASGRFISTLGGTGSNTFGNQGVTVAPGTTGTSYARLLWWISNYVFSNNPTFTCAVLCLGGFTSSDGVGFIGIGEPTISGSGLTETGKKYCGFEFKKTSGTTTLIAVQCDGTSNVDFSGTLNTLTNNDYIELFLKMTSTGVNYYTRLNGGALSSVTTLSSYLPTGAGNYIQFCSSNKGTTTDFQIQLQCAAYEH